LAAFAHFTIDSAQYWISGVKMGEIPLEEVEADWAEFTFDTVRAEFSTCPRGTAGVVPENAEGGKLPDWVGMSRPLTNILSSRPTSNTAAGGIRKPDRQPLP
jgi:hypothetical protein